MVLLGALDNISMFPGVLINSNSFHHQSSTNRLTGPDVRECVWTSGWTTSGQSPISTTCRPPSIHNLYLRYLWNNLTKYSQYTHSTNLSATWIQWKSSWWWLWWERYPMWLLIISSFEIEHHPKPYALNPALFIYSHIKCQVTSTINHQSTWSPLDNIGVNFR